MEKHKNGKARAIDEMPYELIKADGNKIKDTLYKLVCAVFKNSITN